MRVKAHKIGYKRKNRVKSVRNSHLTKQYEERYRNKFRKHH